MQPDELEKAKVYFTSTKGFAMLFRAMSQKYQSLGRWGGSVTLTSPKEEERDAFSTFFRADFSRQRSITISLDRFAKALELTKFSSVSPVRLLEEVQGESLISNAERTAAKEQLKAQFFADLLSRYSQPYCQRWLQAIIEKTPGTRPVHTAFETHLELLKVQMDHVLKALSDMNQQLPGKIERLPIFARRITKDPHGFDSNTDTGRLLIQALRILENEVHDRDQMILALTGTEELTELYYSFGLLRDDLWNFVTCTGITTSEGDNVHKPLGYLSEAYLQNVTLNLPLREVVRIGNAYAGLLNSENSMLNVSCGHPNSASSGAQMSELVQLKLNIETSVTKASTDDSLRWRVSPKRTAINEYYSAEDWFRQSRMSQKEHLAAKVESTPTEAGNGGPLPLVEVGVSRLDESPKAVFVVENSGVFSALLDRFREYCEEVGQTARPNPPLICTHGQFKMASLLLLDKLAASGTMIYYSGDFDPEGLLMMERLLQRFPSQAKPWHYTPADYRLAYSEQGISPQRLKQLERVVSLELRPLIEEIQTTGRAGYQEGILNELWKDLQEWVNDYSEFTDEMAVM